MKDKYEKNILTCRILRLRRICQSDNDFHTRKTELLSFFRRRGYPETLLRRTARKFETMSRADAFHPPVHRGRNQHSDRLRLILTYHPHALAVKNVVLKHFNLLQRDPETREAFPSKPLLVFRRDSNLRDRLVHSRMRPSREPSIHRGTVSCTRRCNTCSFVSTDSSLAFPCQTWTITGSYDCTSRNIIYSIRCSRCNLFYIGETGRRLGDRITEHLRDIRLDNDKPIARHFNSGNHSLAHDLHVCVLRQCGSTTSRKSMERRLIVNLGTLNPHGLNTKTDMSLVP